MEGKSNEKKEKEDKNGCIVKASLDLINDSFPQNS